MSNVLNKKFHLLKNNLELIKKFRNNLAELIFEDKDYFTDKSYKTQLDNLSMWYKHMECVMKLLTDRKLKKVIIN